MKLGLIVRANNRGLGIESWEFYKHLKPYKTLAVCLACDEEETLKRFPDAKISRGMVKEDDYCYFQDCDAVLSFETFYNDRAVERSREFNPHPIYILNPNYEQQCNYYIADKLIVPTVWNFDNWIGAEKNYLPVPVNRELLPFERKTKAKVFVHNAGTQLGDDRNGTLIVLEAMRYVKSEIKLILRVQNLTQILYNKVIGLARGDKRIVLDARPLENYWDLWREGDVFIYPRIYAGLALPTNEAMSRGILVAMTDMNPQNEYLPEELLIKPKFVKEIQMARPIEACEVDPIEVAKKIDWLAGLNEEEVGKLSDRMDLVAQCWDWKILKEKYLNLIQKYVDDNR